MRIRNELRASAVSPRLEESNERTRNSSEGILSFAAGRLRVWGVRSVFSLADQGLTSGASFVANLFLARWLSPSLYGAFALAFAGFLLVTGFHNVIFLEPMTVYGASQYRACVSEYFAAKLRVHVVVVGSLSALVCLVGGIWWAWDSRSPLGPVAVSTGISLPFLLLFLVARRMCYVVQSPRIAVVASGFYFMLMLVGLLLLREAGGITPASTFLLMAFASLCASLLVLRRLSIPVRVSASASHSIRKLLRENWNYGRWLTLTNALSWVSVQAQTFFAGAFLGLAGAGALRAMQLPSLLMTQAIAAATLLILPSLSLELGRGNIRRLCQKAIWSSAALSTIGVLFVFLLFVSASPLERLLFSGQYASAARLIPTLALVPVLMGFSGNLSLVLRLVGRSQFELVAYVLSAMTAFVLAITLMPRWGLRGAAASIIGSAVVLCVAVLFSFLTVGRSALKTAPTHSEVKPRDFPEAGDPVTEG